MSEKKLTPKEFSIELRNCLKLGGVPSPLALIPKNKRLLYEQVVTDYEGTKTCYSPSGMTAAIIMEWLRMQRRSFTLTYNAEDNFYTLSER